MKIKNKVYYILVISIFFTTPAMAQLSKFLEADGFWRDFGNLRSVKLDMTYDDVKKHLGEPNQLLSMEKEGDRNVVEYLYRFREKSTKNAKFVKPKLSLLDKPSKLWNNGYDLIFIFSDGKLIRVKTFKLME